MNSPKRSLASFTGSLVFRDRWNHSGDGSYGAGRLEGLKGLNRVDNHDGGSAGSAIDWREREEVQAGEYM